MLADLKDLGEVGGDGAHLDAVAKVGSDCHAVFALHRDNRATVVRKDAHLEEEDEVEVEVEVEVEERKKKTGAEQIAISVVTSISDSGRKQLTSVEGAK
jgi:hypothetical protein